MSADREVLRVTIPNHDFTPRRDDAEREVTFNDKNNMLPVTFPNHNLDCRSAADAVHNAVVRRQINEVFAKHKGDFNFYYIKKRHQECAKRLKQKYHPRAAELLKKHDELFPGWYDVRDCCGPFIKIHNPFPEDYSQECSFKTIYISRDVPRLAHDVMMGLLNRGAYLEHMDVGVTYPPELALLCGPWRTFLLKHRDNPYAPFMEAIKHQDWTYDKGGKTTIYGVIGAEYDPLDTGNGKSMLVTSEVRQHARYLHGEYDKIQYSDHVERACRDKETPVHVCYAVYPETVTDIIVRVQNRQIMIRLPMIGGEGMDIVPHTDAKTCVQAVINSMFQDTLISDIPLPSAPEPSTSAVPPPPSPLNNKRKQREESSAAAPPSSKRRLEELPHAGGAPLPRDIFFMGYKYTFDNRAAGYLPPPPMPDFPPPPPPMPDCPPPPPPPACL